MQRRVDPTPNGLSELTNTSYLGTPLEEYHEKSLRQLIGILEKIKKQHRVVVHMVLELTRDGEPEEDKLVELQKLLSDLIVEETKVRNALRAQGVQDWRML